MGVRTLRLTAAVLLIQRSRRRLEDEVPLNICLEAQTAILNADFLSVVVDQTVASAKATGAVLALADQRFTATAQQTTMVAVSGLAILADFHASSPG